VGFGFNQTWKDVTAQLDLNTVYTNTTSKAIFVLARISSTPAAAGDAEIHVDGVILPGVSETISAITTRFSIVQALIAPGSTYKVAGSPSFVNPVIVRVMEFS